MNWIEISLAADGEAAEAIADLMYQYGYQGVVIEQGGFALDLWEDEAPPPNNVIVRAYLPDDADAPATQQKLENGLHHLNRIYPAVPQTPTYRTVRDEDWAEAWKAHYKPVRIGERLYIRPAWLEPDTQADDVEIILDPGMAFGTGTHPSTQLCLIALEDLAPPPPRVLDLGCGSGILAIAAAKLGAGQVWALDTDAIAVAATIENAERNGVAEHIAAQQGSLENLLHSPRRFGLILVNILAKIIIPMCEQGLGSLVQPGGVGVFAGIIEEQADDVEAALRATGLIPYRRRMMGDWVAIEARREA
ncbi:MAG: 50S ribosomal protein L11 methyltransferase [Anaerolineae bacterium]|nr:50S ribosomal protein L11 methyltransferase [Anaerolineae bacterium]